MSLETKIRFDKPPSQLAIRTIRRMSQPAVVTEASSESAHQPGSQAASSNGPGAQNKHDDAIAQAQQRDQHIASLLESLSTQLAELKAAMGVNPEQMRSSIIELSCLIASHLIGRAGEAQPFDLSDLVTDAVKQLLPADKITVSIHPEDVVVLSEHHERLIGDGFLTIVRDEGMSRGECRVTSKEHALCSDLELRLENIRETLLGGLDDARSEQRPIAGATKS